MSDQDRQRRPFSVSDVSTRRGRDLKIFNTTTITTTTSTSSHDSQIVTTTLTNRGLSGGTSSYVDTGGGGQVVTNIQRASSDVYRSRSSAADDKNIKINTEYRDNMQTTNSSTTAVPNSKRKIKFVYGGGGTDQDQVVDNFSPLNEKITIGYKNKDPITNETRLYAVGSTTNDNDEQQQVPGFPRVQSSLSQRVPGGGLITNSVVINKNRCNDDDYDDDNYDNADNVEHYDNKMKAAAAENSNNTDNESECNMVVKDVEVECEIDEDPSIFEGSEGYVKSLISKIQNQYKCPETVHIKITRRQKPENIDKDGNIVKKTDNESYGQIVRKEYYTIKASPKHRKRNNISSFVDTTNIPYIDDLTDSESKRNSRAPHDFYIEKHIIYSDCENEQNEIHQVIKTVHRKSLKERNDDDRTKKRRGVREFMKTLSRSKKPDKNVNGKRYESESPRRKTKIKKKEDFEVDVEVEEMPEVKGSGMKGFFKGIGGKIKAPDIHIPDVRVKEEPKVVKVPELKARTTSPSARIELPQIGIETGLPNVDLDLLQGPKLTTAEVVDAEAPEVRGGIKGFFKGIGGRIKAPDIHIPEVKPPQPEVIDLSVPIIDLTVPKIDIRPPKIEKEIKVKKPKIKVPEVEVRTKSPDFDVPPFDLQGPKITGPDVDIDLNAPELRGGLKGFFKGIGGKIKAPDVHIPEVPHKEVNIEVPDLRIKVPEVDLRVEQPDLSIKGPSKVKMPKVRTKSPKVELPNIKVETGLPNVDLELQGPKFTGPEMEMDINSPELRGGLKGFFKGIGGKIKAPDVHLPAADVEVKVSKIELPDIQVPKIEKEIKIKSPKIKVPEVRAKSPKVDILPEIGIETGLPNVDLELQGPKITSSDIDINSPELRGGLKGFFKGIGGKIKAPDVHIPDVKRSTEFEIPGLDVDIKGVKIDVPDVPEIQIKAPKLKEPKIKIKSPKVKVPEVPKVNIETGLPNVDVELHGPKLTGPDLDLDINSPEMKGGVKGFFKGIGGKIKAPDVHIPDVKPTQIELPEVEIKVPKIEKPDISVHVPRIEKEIKVKSPKIKMPEVRVKSPPKVELPEIGIETGLPNLDIQGPQLGEVDVNAPEVKGAMKGFFKGLGGKIKAPDVHIPDVRTKSPDVNIKVASVQLPDAGVDMPEVDINSPELKGGIKGFFKGIGGKIKAPEVDVPCAELCIMTKPKVELDAKVPEAPDVNIKIKKPKVKIPAVRAQSPKVELPEIGIETGLPNVDLEVQGSAHPPKVDLTAPEIKGVMKGFFKGMGGKIKAPDVHIPSEVSIKGPELDVQPPVVKVKSQKVSKKEIKVKLPKVKVPEVRAKSPKVELPEIGIETGLPNIDLDVSAPKLTGPEIDIDSPELKGGIKGFFKGIGGKIKAPEVNVPDLCIKTHHVVLPDIDIKPIEAPTTIKIKSPKIEKPDINIKPLRVKSPELKVKTPKFPEMPKIGVETGLPNVDLDLEGPKLNADLDYDINSPELRGGLKGFFKGIGGRIKAPDVHIPDVKVPELEVPAAEVKVKVPKVKVPKTPEVEIEMPNVDLEGPEAKGSIKGFFKGIGGRIKAPDVHIPEANIDIPNVIDIRGPKIELPDIQVPKIEKEIKVKAPKVKVPEVDVDIKVPKVEKEIKIKSPKIKVREVKANVDLPEIGIETGLPNIDLEGPKISSPDIDINSPELRGGLKGFFKGIGGKIKTPDVHVPEAAEIKTPEVSIEAPKIKVKSPKIQVPKVEKEIKVKTPKVKVPEVRAKSPKVNIFPEIGIETGLPNIDLDMQTPKLTGPEIDIETSKGGAGFKGFFKGIGGRIKAPDVHVPEVVYVKTAEQQPDAFFKDNYEHLNDNLYAKTLHQIKFPDITFKSDSYTQSSATVIDPQAQYITKQLKLEAEQNAPDPAAFGFDMPMTIINNDWHWSADSAKNDDAKSPERRIFHRTFVDVSETTSALIGSGTFAIGDMTYMQNTDFSSSSSKKLEVEHYVTRPQQSPPSIEFEFKKAKIRKDPPFFTYTSVNTCPGEQQLTTTTNNDSTTKNVINISQPPKITTSSGFFRRKLASSSSITNIDSDIKQQQQQQQQHPKSSSLNRAEAKRSSSTKIDYSVPRKCNLYTKSDFNGLGIHIACDKKSRRSPYIHEVEADSPGLVAGLRKHDYILEVNDEDAVNMDFASLISKIQTLIKEDHLCLTVGNEKAYKKWIKEKSGSLTRSSKQSK